MWLLLVGGCSEAPLSCQLTPNIVDRNTDVYPIHDPTIITDDGRYYVYSSSALGAFYSSDDLRSWRAEGNVFEQLPDWLVELIPVADHIGSPDIEHYQGRYVLFYQSHKGNTCFAATGVATNSTLDPGSADYLWQDHGLVLHSRPFYESVEVYCGNELGTFNAIDTHLFVDQDETPYLVLGSTIGGIKLIELDPRTLKPLANASFTTLAQRFLFQSDPIIEAPYIKYRDGFYYLFVSFNHCCLGADTRYQVRVGRAESVTGPYFDESGWPMYLGGGSLLIDGDGAFVGTGHADVFTDKGSDWLVHHAKLPADDYRAYLNIRQLNWRQNEAGEDWPTVCKDG
jgi:arabinan endo-1,5-alpha-L-arabinosidase